MSITETYGFVLVLTLPVVQSTVSISINDLFVCGKQFMVFITHIMINFSYPTLIVILR